MGLFFILVFRIGEGLLVWCVACALFLPFLVRAPPCFPSAWEGREGGAAGEKKMWAGRMKKNTRKNNIKCH